MTYQYYILLELFLYRIEQINIISQFRSSGIGNSFAKAIFHVHFKLFLWYWFSHLLEKCEFQVKSDFLV